MRKIGIVEKFDNFIQAHNCALCKYKKYNTKDDSCFNHQEKDEYGYPVEKCKSLSNIYHGTICKYFPFKQINNLILEYQLNKEYKCYEKMDKKYGDSSLENEDVKFIWGVKSMDDMSSSRANLVTMNDIDVIYDKRTNKYLLGIETAYAFKNHQEECRYLQDCLEMFAGYMEDNHLKKDKPFYLFMSNPCTSMEADSIEELYTNFKIFVDGFWKQNIPMLKGYYQEIGDYL